MIDLSLVEVVTRYARRIPYKRERLDVKLDLLPRQMGMTTS